MQIQKINGIVFQKSNNTAYAGLKPKIKHNVKLNQTKNSNKLSRFITYGVILAAFAGAILLIAKNKGTSVVNGAKDKFKSAFDSVKHKAKNAADSFSANKGVQETPKEEIQKAVVSTEAEKIASQIVEEKPAQAASQISSRVVEVEKPAQADQMLQSAQKENAEPELLYGTFDFPVAFEQPTYAPPAERHRRLGRIMNAPMYTVQTGQLEKRISNAPKVYTQFGTSETLENSVKGLSAEMLDAISDDGFLSVLLAPTDKLKLTQKEKYIVGRKLNNGKNLKPLLQRKYNIERIVYDIASESERAEKLDALEDLISPEEVKAIMQGGGMGAQVKRNDLLKLLVGFNTKSVEENLINSLIK